MLGSTHARRWIWCALLVLAAPAAVLSAQTAETVAEEEIARLIKQLDADSFTAREEATAALAKLGEQVAARLEKLVEDKDQPAEARMRASEALRLIMVERIRSTAIKLPEVLAHVRDADGDKFDAARLEAQLDRIAELMSIETPRKVVLPVRFKDVAKAEPGAAVGIVRNQLITLDAGRVTSVRDSIILAETAVEVSSAQNCIILAGVSAYVSSPRNCIIIAGHDLECLSGTGDNVALSGGTFRGTIFRESIVGAAKDVQMQAASGVTFVNTPVPQRLGAVVGVAAGGETKSVQTAGLDLAMPEYGNALHDSLKPTLIISSPESAVLFRRKDGDGEYVARAGKEIVFPDGKPMPEFAGWKLVFCGRRNLAVFRKEDESAVVRLP